MADNFYLNRTEIAAFIPDPRAQRRFDLMQKTVAGTQEAVEANIGDTQTIREATYITLSANAELPNERVFRWSSGLTTAIDENFITLSLTSAVPRATGGFQVTFVPEGDSSIALPLTGRLATTKNAETFENKTLATPLVTGLEDYADDAAASAGGVPINGLYRTGSSVKVRVS